MWIHIIAAVVQVTFFATRHHYTKPMTVEQCIQAKRCYGPIYVVPADTVTVPVAATN